MDLFHPRHRCGYWGLDQTLRNRWTCFRRPAQSRQTLVPASKAPAPQRLVSACEGEAVIIDGLKFFRGKHDLQAFFATVDHLSFPYSI